MELVLVNNGKEKEKEKEKEKLEITLNTTYINFVKFVPNCKR